MTKINGSLQFLQRVLKDLEQKYKVFYNDRRQSPEQAGWHETEEEYQARQKSWLSKKARGSGQMDQDLTKQE